MDLKDATEVERLEWKQQLKAYCIQMVEQRFERASKAMEEAQRSANEETKSSMGDKYETSRAMAQLDRDMHAKQAEEAQRDLRFLHQITNTVCEKVQPGAVVVTSKTVFFLAIGLGLMKWNDQSLVILNPSSPLATALLNLSAGQSFSFNKQTDTIQLVF